MVLESLKRFASSPFFYLKNPREMVGRVRDVINGSWICMHERKRILGFRNKNIVFYIIRPEAAEPGLMSIHNYVLHKISYAVEKGYIPIVDYQNYKNMYLDNNLLGKVNSWEYFFHQPTQWSLKDVRHSRHVIIGDRYFSAGYYGAEDEKEIVYFHEMIEKYCVVKEHLAKKIQEAGDMLFPLNAKVLGVVGRGTDYMSLKPSHHEIVPDVELLLETVKEKKEQWGYEYVYLATEDRMIYDRMKDEFGDKMLAYDVPRFDHTVKTVLAEINLQRENDKYLRGEDYLITVYLLAQCDGIVAPAVGAALAAIRINGGKYKHKYIFHLGLYE